MDSVETAALDLQITTRDRVEALLLALDDYVDEQERKPATRYLDVFMLCVLSYMYGSFFGAYITCPK